MIKIKHNGVWEEIITAISEGPVDGGNADTLDGHHADEFAKTSDVDDLLVSIDNINIKIGENSVSDQISAAIEDSNDTMVAYVDGQIANIPEFDSTELQEAIKANRTEVDSILASKSDADHNHDSAYDTISDSVM